MAERWIIRVEGKDYGPIDLETLREWQREGRVIPENEAREARAESWTTAARIPGLFAGVPVAVPPVQVTRDGLIAADTIPVRLGPGVSDPGHRGRGFGKILEETFRIYWSRFFSFVGLALIVTLPSVCGQLA